jgi:hypothetical protein
VHRARSLNSGLDGRAVVGVATTPRHAACIPGRVAAPLEAKYSLQQRATSLRIAGEGVNGVETLQRQFFGDIGVRRGQRLVFDLDHRQLQLQALGVAKTQARPMTLVRDALAVEAPRPERKRPLRADPPAEPVNHAGAGAPDLYARVLVKGERGARLTSLGAVVGLADARNILVDAPLHESQPEHPHIEIEVASRVAGYCGDVVNPFEPHPVLSE